MNKELINKYKPEFDHWLNDGTVLMGKRNLFNNTIKWYPSITNPFIEISESIIIIIKDEYFTYRKALAEGKTVQCNAREGQNDITYTAFGHNWWVDTTEFKYATSFYRIKPNEHKFKIGDFIRYIHAHTPKALEINNINCDRYYFVNSNISCLEHELIPWEPAKDEWCWFYDTKTNNHSNLSQFNSMNRNKFQSSSCANWNFCEPFLNSKPSYLRNK